MTESELTLSPATPTLHLAEWLTVERAAYGALSLVALGLRLCNLGARALGPAEAAQALPAWQSAAGRAFDATGVSPLLFQLQRLVFIPFGAADAAPRWPVALAGGLAVLLFFALRDRLGRGGALAAAALWAVSPLAVFLGRLGLDDALVPVLALALLAGLNLYLRDGRVRWLTWAAIALGLLLVSGPGAYTIVLIGLIAALLWGSTRSQLVSGIRQNARTVTIAGLLALGLAATGFFTLPAGLALTTDLLSHWLRDVLPGTSATGAVLPGGYVEPVVYSAWDLLRRLLISEPLLVGTGLVAALYALRWPSGLGRLAALGLLVSLLVAALAPGRQPGDLALVVLALVLLAGPAVAWVLRSAAGWRAELDSWLLLALSLVLLTAGALGLSIGISVYTQAGDRRYFVAIGLIALVMCFALWLIYSWWGNWSLARRVLPALWLVVAGLWGVSQLVGLSYQTEPGKDSGALAFEPGPGWPLLRRELASLSGLYGGGWHEAAIDLVTGAAPSSASAVAEGGLAGSTDPLIPMLLWELKGYEHLQLVQGEVRAQPADVIITPVLAGTKPGASLGVPSTYSGAEFDLLRSWRPDSLSGFATWLRWMLYREAPTPAARWQAVLWINRNVMQPAPASGSFPGLAPGAPAVPVAPVGGAQ